MRDGYYLSTYLHIDEFSHLMGYRIRHDQNISLWHKSLNRVRLVHYWEIERVTGIKQHNKSFYNVEHARETINQLLKTYNLTLDDMVEVWGTPYLQTCDDYHSVDDYPLLSYHSIAHLFSTIMFDANLFYNKNIIGMAIDGGPDWVVDLNVRKKFYYSGCVVKSGEIENVFQIYSPGFIWSFARRFYNLREGTLMALGSASKSEAYIKQHDLLELQDVSALHQAHEYVRELIEKVNSFCEKDEGILFNYFDPRFSIEENKISMVIKEVQKMSLRIMERNIEDIIERYNIVPEDTYLALSGGYVLNCPTNSHLMSKYHFKGFIAPPCVSDCGISLGIALYAFYKKLNGKIEFKMNTAYYGDRDEDLKVVLSENSKFFRFIKNVSDFDLNKAVNDINESPIIWFDGASEVGPRALGNRSILADPRLDVSKEQLNIVKQRQWWRPVAPIVLEDDVNEWFENSYKSPFMLHTFKIKDDKLGLVPAIAHLDNTARVQTLNSNDNPRLYDFIRKFKEKTGIPILCNTSLNDKGEPIVNRIEEAINFALRKGIKIAYINGKRIEFYRHQEYDMSETAPRSIQFVKFSDGEKELLLNSLNPHNVPKDVLIFYYYRPELKTKFNLSDKEDVRKLIMFAKVANDKLGISVIPGA